jgi:wyosine [tRNA(Phe)-imidazoG37] synthetase (radical SAM superfamily)
MTDTSTVKSRLPILTTDRHDRDVVGLRYVYPVVSRRAKGVSIGINLNYDNKCNWRCVYCQVAGLERGAAPAVDLVQLEGELRAFVDAIENGDFLQRHVPLEARRLSDIALSGNGEPTSSPQFREVVELLARLRQEPSILHGLPIVLITNGSLADRTNVQAAILRLSELNGTIWFKLDAGTDAGLRRTNSCSTRLSRHLSRLRTVARLCPTYVQSCWFRREGLEPDPEEVNGYVDALGTLLQTDVPLRGVQLYTLARESCQPESVDLQPVEQAWLDRLATRVTEVGLAVEVVG